MVGKIFVDDREYFLDVDDACPHCHQSKSLEVIGVAKSPERNECGIVIYCRHCKQLSFADLALVGKVLGNDDTKLVGMAYRKA